MGDEPTGLNLSLDDIIKKQQDQTARGGDDRRGRPRGQHRGNRHDGGGDMEMDGGGSGPVRRHHDGGRDRGHYDVGIIIDELFIS
jgi:hypothetical protein